MELRARALEVLCLGEPSVKTAAARALAVASRGAPGNGFTLDADRRLGEPAGIPGRPARPALRPHLQLRHRSPFTGDGRAALLHAIAHIEFNAINLALDAVWRFPGLPTAYYQDWLSVAGEEALHFGLLEEHLASLGFAYGDFDAHDGLWEMTERTGDDVVARMALVPRTLEARGLDATPPLQAKLARAGDTRAVAILEVILRDEVGHVAIGNRWYRWLCDRDGLEPLAHYALLTRRHHAPQPRPPLNRAARQAAGFTEAELLVLERAVAGPEPASPLLHCAPPSPPRTT